MTSNNNDLALVVATRLHLGQASAPPKEEDLRSKIVNFASFCVKAQASVGVIAVDATPVLAAKLENQQQQHQKKKQQQDETVDTNECPAVYDLVEAVQAICLTVDTPNVTLHVLPVTPWGKFVPALNAIIAFAATTTTSTTTSSQKATANSILFVSAETTLASKTALQSLLSHMDLETTLVVGARLPGHDYHGTSAAPAAADDNTKSDVVVPLNGRTTPWNTLAVWNLRKLALTGFVQVSEGILTHGQPNEPSQGVEEVMAISLLQHIFGVEQAQAKLVQLATDDSGGVLWEETFTDPQRQQWHDAKMKSKLERAARQVALFPKSMTKAQVHHC